MLKEATYDKDEPAGFGETSQFRQVLPGMKTSIQLAYALRSETSPIRLQVTDGTPNAFGSELTFTLSWRTDEGRCAASPLIDQ